MELKKLRQGKKYDTIIAWFGTGVLMIYILYARKTKPAKLYGIVGIVFCSILYFEGPDCLLVYLSIAFFILKMINYYLESFVSQYSCHDYII